MISRKNIGEKEFNEMIFQKTEFVNMLHVHITVFHKERATKIVNFT